MSLTEPNFEGRIRSRLKLSYNWHFKGNETNAPKHQSVSRFWTLGKMLAQSSPRSAAYLNRPVSIKPSKYRPRPINYRKSVLCCSIRPNDSNLTRRKQGFKTENEDFLSGVWKSVAGCALSVALLASAHPVLAFSERKVGEFNASGLIFKDAVEVVGIDDPDVEGVTLYLSDFKRSLADKLSKLDFFNEPSQSSITCAATGPVSFKDQSRIGGDSGVEVFSEGRGRSLLFFSNKTLKIRRVYDKERNALLYVSYSTRLTSVGEDQGGVSAGRYKTSLCVLPLGAAPPVVEQ